MPIPSSPLFTRRHFLWQAALTGAVAPAAIRGQAADVLRPAGVAIVGLGGFAGDTVLPELARSTRVRAAALVTGDPAGKGRAWARRWGVPENRVLHYDDMARLADWPEVDYAHIITPTGLHAEHAVRAAAAGKAVLCEKPLATSVADCDRILAACAAAGVRLGVDYRLHWEPHHRWLMAAAAAGRLDGLHSLDAEFSWHRRDDKPWLLERDLAGGGAFADTGVYLVQAGAHLLRRPLRRVTARPTTVRGDYPAGIEETMSVIFEYEGGAVLNARASYAYGRHHLEGRGPDGACGIAGADGGSVFGQSWRAAPSGKVAWIGDERHKVADTLQLLTLHEAFAAAVRDGAPFVTDGAMGRRDIAVVEAVYRAAESGRAVELP